MDKIVVNDHRGVLWKVALCSYVNVDSLLLTLYFDLLILAFKKILFFNTFIPISNKDFGKKNLEKWQATSDMNCCHTATLSKMG